MERIELMTCDLRQHVYEQPKLQEKCVSSRARNAHATKKSKQTVSLKDNSDRGSALLSTRALFCFSTLGAGAFIGVCCSSLAVSMPSATGAFTGICCCSLAAPQEPQQRRIVQVACLSQEPAPFANLIDSKLKPAGNLALVKFTKKKHTHPSEA